MALIDVVKWDGTPDLFAYRFPETNLTSLTQVIVNQSQEAALFHKGELVQLLGPGKHTLSNENFPVLEKLYGIPFGGSNPFTAEIWFVNKVAVLDVKWGTHTPMLMKDPQYNVLIPVRAYGQFGIQISDTQLFLVKLVGTLSLFTKTDLGEYFKGVLMSNISSIVAKKIVEEKISVLEIATQLKIISKAIQGDIAEEFAQYGIWVANFYVHSISVPEDDKAVVHLRDLLSRKAEMDMLGYTYQQERSFDVLENAAQNEGTAGSVMGAGLGLGMGFGIGDAVSGMMKGVNQQTASSSTVVQPESNAMCNKCGGTYPISSKFCPHCGDVYNACRKCGTDNDPEATTCRKCGSELDVACNNCNTKLAAGTKFCPECGQSMVKSCAKCGKVLKGQVKFCPECGEKVL